MKELRVQDCMLIILEQEVHQDIPLRLVEDIEKFVNHFQKL